MRATADEALSDIKLGLVCNCLESGKKDPRRWCVFCKREFKHGEGYYQGTSDFFPKKYRPAGSHKRWYACNSCFKEKHSKVTA